MWRDRTNLYATAAPARICNIHLDAHTDRAYFRSYISYRQSYAHHPTHRNRYGPSAPGSGLGGGDRFGGGGASTAVLFSADDDRRGLLSAGAYNDDADGAGPGDAAIEMDLLPPRWADVADEVAELLAAIAAQSQELERLHQKHVLPGFNDDEAKRAEEGEIERLTQQITRGFHDCHRCIKRIEQMARDGPMSRADETMAKNIQISLATRVQEASAGFRKKQSAYLKSECGPRVPARRSLTVAQSCEAWVEWLALPTACLLLCLAAVADTWTLRCSSPMRTAPSHSRRYKRRHTRSSCNPTIPP